MKVLMLSDLACPHTIKWIRSLSEKGIEIYGVGLSEYDTDLYRDYKNVKTDCLWITKDFMKSGEGKLSKLKYLKALPRIKKIIKEFQPDILHAHYASSYGLLGALCGFSPYIVSVWGSDVYDFPHKSLLHKQILKFNLKKADKILSTSHVMAKETEKYTNKLIEVTPFGIDLDYFKPMKQKFERFHGNEIVIGTVKTLEPKYGIEYLIKAFSIVHKHHQNTSLLIVGKGELREDLEKLCAVLKIDKHVQFTGWIPYDDVPKYHNTLDIAVYPSILDSESFGVAVIESGACEKPVIVSRKGGLVEVVKENETGLVVEAKDPKLLADAITKLVENPELRNKMGSAARLRVKDLYRWEDNVNLMVEKYQNVLN